MSTTTNVHTVLVCLADSPQPRHAAHAATTHLAKLGITANGVMPHFTPRRTGRLRGRLRTRQLIDTWHNTTAGGPIHLLDLAGMRARARRRPPPSGWSGTTRSPEPDRHSRSGPSPNATSTTPPDTR